MSATDLVGRVAGPARPAQPGSVPDREAAGGARRRRHHVRRPGVGSGREPFDFAHGQFNMLTSFGVGEVAISISSAPADEGPIEHTVRDVGAVTRALCAAPVGSVIGVRGPRA